MKIISIVGTRPQFLKLIPLTIELDKHSTIEHIVIHSGQHYDNNMSSDLFTSFIQQLLYFLFDLLLLLLQVPFGSVTVTVSDESLSI